MTLCRSRSIDGAVFGANGAECLPFYFILPHWNYSERWKEVLECDGWLLEEEKSVTNEAGLHAIFFFFQFCPMGMEGSLQVKYIVPLRAYIDQNFLRMKLNRCRSFQPYPVGITENDGSEPPSATFYLSRSRHGQEFCMNEVDYMQFDSTLLH